MWLYALPLVPLGLLGWVNSLGDRYLIGGVLDLAAAGVYAAVYGLSSAPPMIIGGMAEQALRPLFQDCITHRERQRARRIFVAWLATVAVGCGVVVIALAEWHREIAMLLVGPAYRGASGLMPWIAAGYGARSISYVFERVCYAHGQTRRVLVTQLAGAAATLVATPIGALGWGLKGAAVAVPICFGAQLIVSVILARRTQQQAERGAAVRHIAGATT
jgi:O-antigen/teichoic acid export membrane protein